MKDECTNFNMFMIRDEKFSLGGGDRVVLSFDKKDVEVLLDEMDTYINACKRFNTFVNRFSTIGARSVVNDAIITLATLNPILIGFKYILSSYRLMLKSSLIINNTSASAFNYSRGNIKKCLEVCETAIINLEMDERNKGR